MENQDMPNSVVASPEIKPKPSRTVLILSILLVAMTCVAAVLGYLLLTSQCSKCDVAESPEPQTVSTPTPAETMPSATPQPSTTSTANPSEPSATILSYQLPQGWQTATDNGRTFEVGYDATKFRQVSIPSTITSRIDMAGPFNFFVRIEPYDGGSRHAFLQQFYKGYGTLPTTYEKNYLVNGKSALVIYNVDASATNIIGMVTINQSEAFSFSATGGTEKEIETLLASLRVL